MRNQLLHNKRGEAIEDSGWMNIAFIVYAIFVGLVGTLLVLSMFEAKQKFVQIPDEVAEQAYVSRFLLSNNCLVYDDPAINRVYSSVMDWSKFSSNSAIESCYQGTEKDWSFKLELTQISPDGKKGATREINTQYYAKDSLHDVFMSFPVLIKDESNPVSSGFLVIKIQK